MTAEDLKDFRKRARLSQAEMADLLALSTRQYQEIESDRAELSARHWLQAERVSLKLAVARKDIGLAFATIRRDALDFAALVRGEETEK